MTIDAPFHGEGAFFYVRVSDVIKMSMETLFLYWKQLVYWLSGVSVVTLVGSMIAVPWVVGRIPVDYFTRKRLKSPDPSASAGRYIRSVIKNILGVLFISIGIILLFLPGQGILMIVAGVLLADFPGKRKLLTFLLQHEKTRASMNWVRQKMQKPPFEWDNYS